MTKITIIIEVDEKSATITQLPPQNEPQQSSKLEETQVTKVVDKPEDVKQESLSVPTKVDKTLVRCLRYNRKTYQKRAKTCDSCRIGNLCYLKTSKFDKESNLVEIFMDKNEEDYIPQDEEE